MRLTKEILLEADKQICIHNDSEYPGNLFGFHLRIAKVILRENGFYTYTDGITKIIQLKHF